MAAIHGHLHDDRWRTLASFVPSSTILKGCRLSSDVVKQALKPCNEVKSFELSQPSAIMAAMKQSQRLLCFCLASAASSGWYIL
ncbi:hypothetical protein H310_14261 [Aphanomyces invadans]|uniref:Uncharacterized protein n=1 Tax=Aphanomyces invadans TaxID=157072 RepID=A0A024TAC5_9STRA|nr:hypothetical protein H310_14261 [Aphanomyces invadans]ETV91105.1 hypothetical protein H310_14261 [Aphanomyces invadans]|eukprot:XP_008880301.1 hypothetical protein H310_14261 [Aphanomyces invadans]